MSPAPLTANRHRRACVGLAAALSVLAIHCSKGKDDDPVSAPLPPPSTSVDRLSTGIGVGRSIDPEAAPSTVRWRRVIAVDDKRAVFVGDLGGEPIALSTENGGRNWRAIRGEQAAWSAWAVAEDATLMLASGTRSARAGAAPSLIDSVRVAFAAPDAKLFGPATVVLPEEGSKRRPKLAAEALQPAALSRDVAAFVIEDSPGRAAVHYAGAPGVMVGPPVHLPAGERPGSTPLGHPPMLLSVRGRQLLARRLPPPGTPLGPGVPIPGVIATPALAAELSRPPACEAGRWGMSRVTQGTKLHALLVSSDRAEVVALPAEPPAPPAPRPPGSAAGASVAAPSAPAFGCGAASFVIETRDASGGPSLTTCTLEGACVVPKTSPFRAWPEPHTRVVVAATTTRGTLALLSAQAGERWGVYLAQSSDAGSSYELPRVVGEGSGERGRLEIGALVSLGNRALLLLAADVVGTSRRGWYVLASDDGGATWTPP